MKKEEKNLARDLRKQGWSLNKIREKLRVSKSSVSIWVRDVELTEKQKQELLGCGLKVEVIEKRRNTRLKNEADRKQDIIDKAEADIKHITKKELFLTGLSLYWAEGAKTIRSGVQFSNSDPDAIKFIMLFFRKCCDVPEKKFRGRVYIHPHLNERKAQKYWHLISDIPLSQFHKSAIKISKASKQKKDNLPFGTFCIQICNMELFFKIKGWMKGLSKATIR